MATVESIHVIYKNLINVGKELDVDRFREFFISKGFVQNERVIPTPAGPLKEYLLRDPQNMRDLVVCSVKGFVVDSKDIENTKRLMALSYEIFESIYGDLFTSLVLDIQILVRALVFVKDGYKILLKSMNLNTLKKIGEIIGEKNLKPRTIGFYWGSKSSPLGWTAIQIKPLETHRAEVIKDRLTLVIEHFHTDPDLGAEFIASLDKFLKKLIKAFFMIK